MLPRRLTAVLALPLAWALVACSSSSTPAKHTATSATGTAGTSTDTAALVGRLQHGIASVTSAHFTIAASVTGQPLTGSGDQQLAGGTLVALDATATLPSGLGSVELRNVDGKNYARLPKALSVGDKPWTAVTTDTTNPALAQVASIVESALGSASLGNLARLAGAASNSRDLGRPTVDGTATTHYAITVDPAKLPADLGAVSAKPFPVDLWVDGTGRPVRLQLALTVAGTAATATIDFSRFGAPVHITAPPADQVGTG